MWPPPDEVGTVNVVPDGIPPEAVVVTVPGEVTRVDPSYVKTRSELGVNPPPVTVTTVPSGPLTGERTMKGFTVKVALDAMKPLEEL